MRRWICLAVAIIAPAIARADEADRLFQDGNAAMDRNQPRAAAAAFRAAWQVAPRAKIALDLGVALAEAGDTAGAAEAFEVYLADPASDPAKRIVLERQLAAWRLRLGRIALHVTPGDAAIAIDGVRPLESGDVNVPAGPGVHRISVERPGFARRELTVTVVARQTAEAREELVELAPRGQEMDPYRTSMWTTLGVAGASVAVGTIASIVAVERWNTVHDHCPGDVCATPADLARADGARRAGYVADVAFVVGGVALASAAVLWKLAPVAVAPTPHGAMASWHARF